MIARGTGERGTQRGVMCRGWHQERARGRGEKSDGARWAPPGLPRWRCSGECRGWLRRGECRGTRRRPGPARRAGRRSSGRGLSSEVAGAAIADLEPGRQSASSALAPASPPSAPALTLRHRGPLR
eukprot:3120715-Rhodomonas_salina.5